MRVLVECTYVYEHPRHNSGIQRVVRNMVSELGKIRKEEFICIPVIFRNNRIYHVKKLFAESSWMKFVNRLYAKMVLIRERLQIGYLQVGENERLPMRQFFGYALTGVFKSVDFLFYLLIGFVLKRFLSCEINERLVELTIQSDDVLILLDASWHTEYFTQIEQYRLRGVQVVTVIYDLIPLTHPQYCHKRLVSLFHHWFKKVYPLTDGFMTISNTILNQMQNYLWQNSIKPPRHNQWFDYFQLGSELDMVRENSEIYTGVEIFFSREKPVYLMVGTIEPKKNHSYLLDAFEYLWKQDLNVALCIVGKVTWNFNALLRRIRNHGEFNKRLIMFNDLSDTELDFCYRNARCLLLPAYIEGFGLPLIEALQHKLPVMASDIPVFREVGGDFIAYFDPDNPETLATLISRFELNNKLPAKNKIEDWCWPDCAESARQFLSKVGYHVALSRNEA